MNAVGTRPRIRVLVIEDSASVRDLLVYILGKDPGIEVVATGADGVEAVELARRHRPDVITMDIHMPRLNGLEATRRIMETVPTPIVIVSASASHSEVEATFEALQAGALAMVDKPQGLGQTAGRGAADKLLETVKLMSEVKVVRRWPRVAAPAAEADAAAPAVADLAPGMDSPPAGARAAAAIGVVAMGASTGGPVVLQTILAGLPAGLLAPVLIVQHISVGFTEGFVEWLAHSTGFPVHLAEDGAPARAGHAYVAPDGLHLGVAPGPRLALAAGPPEHGHRPAVAYLFRSAARAFGPGAAGVLLSGMGRDGAEELRLMKERGAVTIAQDRESSAVPGMPGEAIRLDAAHYVLSPERIAATLGQLVGTGRG